MSSGKYVCVNWFCIPFRFNKKDCIIIFIKPYQINFCVFIPPPAKLIESWEFFLSYIFLLAAKRLGVQPEESVVIEDGTSGMIGATAANMKSIGLVADITADYPATKLVSSLKEVSINVIHEL